MMLTVVNMYCSMLKKEHITMTYRTLLAVEMIVISRKINTTEMAKALSGNQM